MDPFIVYRLACSNGMVLPKETKAAVHQSHLDDPGWILESLEPFILSVIPAWERAGGLLSQALNEDLPDFDAALGMIRDRHSLCHRQGLAWPQPLQPGQRDHALRPSPVVEGGSGESSHGASAQARQELVESLAKNVSRGVVALPDGIGSKLPRMLKVLTIIQGNHYITAGELARKCEVSSTAAGTELRAFSSHRFS